MDRKTGTILITCGRTLVSKIVELTGGGRHTFLKACRLTREEGAKAGESGDA